ncbi:MAG: tRNA lysidine(34) synthetase TilS [Deltaproteobacteria bacterium]|nr:tRNA lysidine(34) synthetase TilS [Deltaproteobacteria bacterium]
MSVHPKRNPMIGHPFIEKVADTIGKWGMLQTGDSILVATSGGPDSVAMLHGLMALASDHQWRIGVAHLNHGLRPGNAQRDESFVIKLAQNLKLPFFTETADVEAFKHRHRLSLEEAARNVRHRFLGQVARQNGFSIIALGHHADDNAEQILLNLIRGSGLTGLAGIPPVRTIPVENTRPLQIVRPLMEVTKANIVGFLSDFHLACVIDETNTDFKFRRNRIRHELLPMLRDNYNPNIINTINRLASVIRTDNAWTDQEACRQMANATLDQTVDRIILAIGPMQKMPIGLQHRIFRSAIRAVKQNLRRISNRHILDLATLVRHGPELGQLHLPDNIRATREHDRLTISREKISLRKQAARQPGAKSFEYVLKRPGEVFIKAIGMKLQAIEQSAKPLPDFRKAGHSVAFFDMDSLEFPLTIRNVRPGDRFQPLGMTGTQKVKKLFIDRKIPRTQRSRCPIVMSRGQIIWVAGHRIADPVKVTDMTRRILAVTLNLPNSQ